MLGSVGKGIVNETANVVMLVYKPSAKPAVTTRVSTSSVFPPSVQRSMDKLKIMCL